MQKTPLIKRLLADAVPVIHLPAALLYIHVVKGWPTKERSGDLCGRPAVDKCCLMIIMVINSP